MKENPYQAYKQNSVMTMTPGELLVALFDGINKELTLAQGALAQQNMAQVNARLQKAQTMINVLNNTLDHKYPVSQSLSQLYDYFLHIIISANMSKDLSQLPEIISMISELRETYAKADRLSRTADQAAVSNG